MQALTFALAQGLGFAAARIRIPGFGIIVPMFATAAVAIWLGVEPAPPWARFVILVLMGTIIGAQIDRESLLSLRRILAGATVAAVAIIALGVVTTLVLRRVGLAPHGDLLATSPGALSAMTAAALEHDFDAPTVAVFHITRILLIVVSIPLLVRAMDRSRRGGAAAQDAGVAPSPAPSGAPRVPTEPIGHRTVPVSDPAASRARRVGRFLVPTAGAALVAALGIAIDTPLPIVVTAFLGSGAVALLAPRTVGLPKGVGLFVQSGLAWLIGTLVTRDTLATLGTTLIAATVSSVVLVIGGLLIAFALRRMGLSVDGDVLATSPGALEVLTIVGADHGASVVDIGLFHLLRLLLVMLTLPLLLVWTM